MKLIPFLLLLFCCSSFAQIKNADFESGRDSFPAIPQNWNYKTIDGYKNTLDSIIYFSGSRSMSISTVKALAGNTFQAFSQVCDIEINQLKDISITAYIKTDKVKGSASLWCQLWNKDDKTIGFGNLGMQNIIITGDNDWKKYSLNLVAGPDVKKLLLGGFLAGEGTAWFDKFEIEYKVSADSTVSEPVTKYVSEFIKIIQSYSLFTDSINWKVLKNETGELSKGIKTIEDSRIVTNYILSKLRTAGDNHSFFLPQQNAENYSSKNMDGRPPEANYLGDHIGLIKVPGFGSVNDTAGINFALKIQDLIRSVESADTIKGWIIDLRENTGGNMYPMIAGLGPLVGKGVAGYFITSRTETPWKYEDIIRTGVKIKKPYHLKYDNIKIAVLIGPKTSSSGEMTTISFIGKPNTRLFGQPSGGYTTGNQGFKLSDGAYLYLATSYTSDRNKKKYLHKIEPDVVVPILKENDNTIDTAKKWLLEK